MTYIVKKGDTLYGISNQFGVSVTELAELNQVDAKTLQIGQVLTIPDKSGENPNNMFYYTVKKGDTLYSIARKYNTTVSDIININYLKNTNLSIGQVIRIPEKYFSDDEIVLPQYQNYIVQKGDTLYSIAKMFNVQVSTIRKDNSLESDVLYPNQQLKIRTNIEIIEECFGEEFDIPETSKTSYTVKKGDTLYSIAKRFNTSVSNILENNNLKNTNLSIGQVLIIEGV